MTFKIILHFKKEVHLFKKHFSVCIEQKRENERDIGGKRDRERSTQFEGVSNGPSHRGRVLFTPELD